MNIEYINLQDGTTIVTDENSKINKRDPKVSERTLILENKVEKVENEIEIINKKLSDKKGVVNLSKAMLKFQPLLILGMTLCSFILGGAFSSDFFAYGIYHGLGGLLASTAFAGFTAVYYSVISSISKKNIEYLETRLEKAEIIKSDYVNEIERIKQIDFEDVMNKPISLTEKNKIELSKVEEQLDKSTLDAIKKKKEQKKLVLKKKGQN